MNVLVLLDEPDLGLSPRSILRAVETLRTVAAGGSQVLATAHNPWLIAAFPEVLSLERERSADHGGHRGDDPRHRGHPRGVDGSRWCGEGVRGRGSRHARCRVGDPTGRLRTFRGR